MALMLLTCTAARRTIYGQYIAINMLTNGSLGQGALLQGLGLTRSAGEEVSGLAAVPHHHVALHLLGGGRVHHDRVLRAVPALWRSVSIYIGKIMLPTSAQITKSNDSNEFGTMSKHFTILVANVTYREGRRTSVMPESSFRNTCPASPVVTMSCTVVTSTPALATRKVPGSISSLISLPVS